MSDDAPTLQIVTRQQLESGDVHARWDDPARLALPTPAKRQALLSNPFSVPEDPAQIIGLIGNQVVGRMDVIPGEISVMGTPTRVLYGSLLFVEEKFRHTGIGLMILLKMQSLHHTVAVCGISQMIYPMYQKLRWIDFPMRRMVMVRRSRAVMDSLIGNRLVSRTASVAADVALFAQRSILRALLAIRLRGLEIAGEKSIPPELEASLRGGDGQIASSRTAAWCDWLLANRFDGDSTQRRQLLVIRERGGKPLAFCLTKSRHYSSVTQRQLKNITLGSVQDWMTMDAQKVSESTLVLLAVDSLLRSKVDAVEVCCQQPQLASFLKHRGFVGAGMLHYLLRAVPPSPLFKKDLHRPELWRLRPDEGDNFFS
ncbi:MAG TPA: hypothetical protein VH370_20275 [Humisphaera sp.]|nr:hypothetical protein [Humisphaera sp.]